MDKNIVITDAHVQTSGRDDLVQNGPKETLSTGEYEMCLFIDVLDIGEKKDM